MNITKLVKQFSHLLKNKLGLKRGSAFMLIILTALIAFEIFNYSTTDFALSDLLGDLRFAGIRWATILSIAFCGIDFAGIARLFTPETTAEEPKQIWYLFGAWLLAATMNAILTWWGVAMGIANHPITSGSVIPPKTLITIVPIFVAIMVWLIRILIIGSLSRQGDQRLYGKTQQKTTYQQKRTSEGPQNISPHPQNQPKPRPINPAPKPKPVFRPENTYARRPEPTYHSLSMSGQRKKK
jgi:membrane protein implicated in regulation of membrane protease activity